MAEETPSVRVWLIADAHAQAVAALQGALEERNAVVERLDLSDAFERVVRQRGGQLLDSIKDIFRRGDEDDEPSDDEEGSQRPQALTEAIERGAPDIIAFTSPKLLKGTDLLGKAVGDDALRVALLPDYNLGAAWLQGAVHAFVIPHDGLRAPLQDAGVAPERIFVAGPAIARTYAEAPDAQALRQDFGLNTDDGALAFVLCQGFDVADLDRMVFQFSLVDRPWQPIFYVGDDAETAEMLRRATRTHGLPARLLGAVPNVHDFISVAQLVITDPKDEAVVGALALDRPLLLIGDPGPVTTQCDFLVSQGAALHVRDVLRLGAEVELAVRPEKLEAMAEASAKVGRRTGTQEVADALMLVLERRAELAVAPSPPEEEQGPTIKGPFELIGASKPEGGARPPAPEPAPSGGPFESLRPSAPKQPQWSPAPASRLSAAEAKDQLAALIVQERKLERQLEEARREQERWSKRRDLATQWNENDLAVEAERLLRRALSQAESADQQLTSVRLQKDKLKARVRGGSAPVGRAPEPPSAGPASRPDGGKSDGRFQDMEIEDDLSRLKARLRDELD